MHEFGLCEGVLAAVRRHAGGRPVAGIRVRFGVLHAVDTESLQQAFLVVAEGTEAAGAEVDLVSVPARIACRDCGFDAETSDPLAVCKHCGSDRVDIDGGDEMILESVRYAPAAGQRIG
jgi:hydrogenase nickel incorporation protein HypA/HybF